MAYKTIDTFIREFLEERGIMPVLSDISTGKSASMPCLAFIWHDDDSPDYKAIEGKYQGGTYLLVDVYELDPEKDRWKSPPGEFYFFGVTNGNLYHTYYNPDVEIHLMRGPSVSMYRYDSSTYSRLNIGRCRSSDSPEEMRQQGSIIYNKTRRQKIFGELGIKKTSSPVL